MLLFTYISELPSTTLLLTITYLYALIWTASPLLGWGEYALEPSRLACTLVWYRLSVSYFTALVVAGYCVPLAVIAYCYIKIWWYLRQSKQERSFATVCSTKKVSLTKVRYIR